jgi:hypothetical protein
MQTKNALSIALAQRGKRAQWAQQTGATGAIGRTHTFYWKDSDITSSWQ